MAVSKADWVDQPGEVPPSEDGAVTNTATSNPEDKARARRDHRWQLAFFVAVCCIVLLMLLGPGVVPPKVDNLHYVYLAHSMTEGKLTVDNIPTSYADVVTFQGHKYLPFGPLPAVVLIPFLPILDLGVHIVWVGYLLTLLNIWLLYRILDATGIKDERRPWALLLFFGGTVYLSVALVGSSYFLAAVLTVTCVLLAILEVLTKRRPWLIGIFIGLAGMTRLTSVFVLPFFMWMLWKGTSTNPMVDASTEEDGAQATQTRLSKVAANYALLFAGLAGPILLLLAYNYLRFGNILESGYNMAVLTYQPFVDARSYGLFSLAHIPKNLFMMFLQGFTAYPSDDAPVLLFPYLMPSPWGMGLIYTSPAIFYAFRSKVKEPFVKACWLGIVVAMIPIITYYGIGWIQFGYRYALDFLPLALLLAARGFPNPMTNLSKALVLASVAVSTWGAVILLTWIHIAG
jgi:hypothetical protein